MTFTLKDAPGARRPGDRWRTAARGVGQTLITIGLVLLLFVAYELWGTGLYTAQQQDRLQRQLTDLWNKPGAPDPATGPGLHKVALGSGIAVLRIPRFGSGYHLVIVEGTQYEDLKKGPGHYPDSALPGQVGNFAVAGHRTTYGAPFNKLDILRPGDAIVLETRDRWFTYEVGDVDDVEGYPRIPYQEIVEPTRVDVAYPVPDQPDPVASPTARLLTFTSCNPKYSAAQRIVVHARLAETLKKSTGETPAALTEGRRD